MACPSDPEGLAQTGDDARLRALGTRCDEDRVVPGERADDLGPLRLVDGHGNALCSAGRGAYHRQAGAGALDLLHELRKRGEVAIGAHDLARRELVAAARL